MPRRTHPAARAKHPRAHTRHHRDRVIAARTRRLRDERVVRALDNRWNLGWRGQPAPLPTVWELAGRLHDQTAADAALTLPHHGGLDDRLAYRDAPKDPDTLPCGCCWRRAADPSGQPPADAMIAEQLRDTDPPAGPVTGPRSGMQGHKERRAQERRWRRRALERHVAERMHNPYSPLPDLCAELGPEDAFERTICSTSLWRGATPAMRDRAIDTFIALLERM